MKLIQIPYLTLFMFSAFVKAADCPTWTSEEAEHHLTSLASEVMQHDILYHEHNAPTISDAEYDALEQQLTRLQDCFSNISVPRYQPHADKGSIKHAAFMGSLRKAENQQDIESFIAQWKGTPLILQPKIDGIAVELVYSKGQLITASTRGNGEAGENISGPIKQMPLIPQQLTEALDIVLHGELFARLDLAASSLLKPYASARHFVAGQVNRKMPDKEALKVIDFFPWRWVNSSMPTESERLKTLHKLGFLNSAEYTHFTTSLAEIYDWQKLYQQMSLPFLTDGVVIKTDIGQQGTVTAKKPDWAIALKYPPDTSLTEVMNIEFNIGRTGHITPVLELKPVEMGGETISRVSLGSIENLKRKEVAVGDQVSIQLKGSANPVFGRIITRPDDRKLISPPDAGRYSAFTCLSYSADCEQQFITRLKWLSKESMLDLPLSEPQIKALIGSEIIHDVGDIMKVSFNELKQAGFSDEHARYFIAARNTIHGTPFKRQLQALSIPHIGNARASRISARIKNWQDFLAADIEQLKDIGSLNSKQVQEIRLYLDQRAILSFIK